MVVVGQSETVGKSHRRYGERVPLRRRQGVCFREECVSVGNGQKFLEECESSH